MLGVAGAAALLTPALAAGAATGGAAAARAATSRGFTVVIAPGFANGELLQPALDSKRAGADIVTEPADRHQLAQRWAFVPQRGVSHQYEIENLHNRLCITTDGIPGRPVHQERCRDLLGQRWNVNLAEPPAGTVWSAHRARHGRLYLGTTQLNRVNGGATMIAGYGTQRDLYYILVLGPLPGRGFHTGLGIQLSGGGTGVLDVGTVSGLLGPGTILDAPDVPLATSQDWIFVSEGNYNYEIENASTHRCLTTDGEAGDPVEQQACVQNTEELWSTGLKPGGTDWMVESDYFGPLGYLWLESQGADPQLGDVIDTWEYNGGSNQTFSAIPLSG
jgi:hypothetical protein